MRWFVRGCGVDGGAGSSGVDSGGGGAGSSGVDASELIMVVVVVVVVMVVVGLMHRG